MSNDILELRGPFERRGAKNPGPPSLPKGKNVDAEHLKELRKQLEGILESWREMTELGIPVIVSVKYIRVIAKSNRAKRLLSEKADDASTHIVGAKLDCSNDPRNPKHIITYCVSPENIEATIHCLKTCEDYIRINFGESISQENLDSIAKKGFRNKLRGLSKTAFMQAVRDAYFIESFFIEKQAPSILDESFVTLYDTKIDTKELLDKIGLRDIQGTRIIDRSIRLYDDEYDLLRRKAPFLIAMGTLDLADFGNHHANEYPAKHAEAPDMPEIDSPHNEPFVGVIDIVFSKGSYFDEWVKSDDLSDPDIPFGKDKEHGTKVASIIVDGPALNPWLEDGCGRFCVKHFGVARSDKVSTFRLLRDIREIVESNASIKVWNLSLGDPCECPENFISPIGALLDELQAKCDVMFVVAGTNIDPEHPSERIGAPADSINSLVVNSVNEEKEPAEYSRRGPILSFYGKPDIAYYGGTKEAPLRVATSKGITTDYGTSFAAPWITRKVAFLIYKANRSKEEAKALIIDSAYGWESEPPSRVTGFGVPPIRISDILSTENNEIRFVVSTIVDSYETYNHRIPIPTDKNGRYPFMARATLCYFPHCKRSQGVDYTNTEIDLHFGRIKRSERIKKDADGKSFSDTTYNIVSLDGNNQGDEGCMNYEGPARLMYRKWDNIKHICDKPKKRFSPRKSYDGQDWGLLLRRKSRENAIDTPPLRVCVVVTLKEMMGNNRFDDFTRDCSLKSGWIVNRLSVDIINEIHAEASKDIDFE